MRKPSITVIFLFFWTSVIICQEWQYSSVIKGSVIEPRVSAIDLEGNLYTLSLFADTIYSPTVISYGTSDLLLCKFNSVGELIWYRHIGNKKSDTPGGITVDNNFLYISGTYYDTCLFDGGNQLIHTGNGDIFLAKYTLDGDIVFSKRVGSSSSLQSSTHIKFDGSQRIIMSGFYRDSLVIGSTISDMDTLLSNTNVTNFIAAFNLDGEHVWSKRILGNNNLSRINKIAIGQTGYYFGGYFQGDLFLDVGTISSYALTTYDVYIYKTDFNGNGQWSRLIRGQNTENFRTLSTDEFDNVYVLGNYNSPTIYVDSTESTVKTIYGNAGGHDTFLGKYNRSGILQWFNRKGSTSKDIYNDFVFRNNIIYATGYFTNQIIFNNDTLKTTGSLNSDAFVAAFNQIGDPISGVSIVGTGDYLDAGTIVNMDKNSRAYVSGYFKSQQIKIGDQTYTSNNINKSDLFFAIYQHPFKAVITDENMLSCSGLSDGMLTVTPYFGRPPYTYSWSHNPALNNPVAEGLSAGKYTVTITDANDSTASITGEVIQPAVLDIQGLITPVTCNNDQDGAINITAAGGNGDFSYFWTTLDGSGISPLLEDQSGLSAGTYTVVVEDKKKCTATADFTVTEPGKFRFDGTIITDVTTPPGNNGAIDLKPSGGTSPYTFAWTGPDGFSATDEDPANLASGGLYKLTITDAGMCTTDTSFLVNDSFTMIAQIVKKTDVLCYNGNNGTATVRVTNGTPPYTYDWGPLGTIVDSTQVGLTARDYIVTVRDSESKVASASVSILQPSAELTIVLNPSDLFCSGDNSGVIDLTVSGGTLPYSFSWNNGYSGEDLVNVAAGVYTATVTDVNGCTTQDTKEVSQPEPLGLSIVPSGQILCHGDLSAIATANATGGTPPGSYTYQWDDPGTQTTQTAYDLGAGTWHVTVRDSNNCSTTGEITILQPSPLAVNTQVINPSCPGLNDGSIIPTPAGGSGAGYEYIWSNGVYQRFNTDITSGTYILTMNDGNNCVITDTFSIVDPEKVEITSLNATDITCLGKTDGVINITAEGGTGVYSYSTNGGLTFGTSSVVSGVAAGEYEVLAIDENDCASESYPVTITAADTVIISSLNFINPQCEGIDDGTLEITASGGSGIYEYCSDGGTNFVATSVIASLSAGEYNVIVRDDNDCTSEIMPVSLSFSDTVKIDEIETTDLSCSGLSDGAVSIKASGGSGIYRYSTDGGESFGVESNFGSLAAGTYAVVVKDENECLSAESEVTLLTADVCGLIVYDGFSPNNDGKNDVWNIGNAGSFPNLQVKIFNMWGKIVFSSKGYGTPWDGTFNGNQLPSGTYYYVIDPGDGTPVITGDVSIVK